MSATAESLLSSLVNFILHVSCCMLSKLQVNAMSVTSLLTTLSIGTLESMTHALEASRKSQRQLTMQIGN
jgi:hypothetical protein